MPDPQPGGAVGASFCVRSGVDRRLSGHTPFEGFAMMLTFLTVIAAAVLGGAVALELTALVVLAGVALVVIGAANGVRTIGRTFQLL